MKRTMAQSRKHGSQPPAHSGLFSFTLSTSPPPSRMFPIRSDRRNPTRLGIFLSALCMIGTMVLAAAPAIAQPTPYKLIILWGSTGIAVTDYPSASRCEAARAALQRRKEVEVRERGPKPLEGGGVLYSPPWQMELACIPG